MHGYWHLYNKRSIDSRDGKQTIIPNADLCKNMCYFFKHLVGDEEKSRVLNLPRFAASPELEILHAALTGPHPSSPRQTIDRTHQIQG